MTTKKGQKEAFMKGTFKSLALLGVVGMLATGCSTMKEIEVRETKAHPKWYEDCEQIGSEGFFFFNREDYAYSCGMGESKFEQASESQAYAFAVKGFAERINGVVQSNTNINIQGNNGVESRVHQTIVEHSTQNTSIREHLEVKKYAYELGTTGKVHTYVRIKMPLEVFNGLLQEAKDDKNSARITSLSNNN